MATLNGVNYSNTSGLLLKTNSTTQMSISTGGVIEFNQSYTFPTSDGSANTVLLTNGSGALSFSTIPNASLDNSSITINGASVSLGGSINVGDITGVSAGNGLTGGGTSGSVTLNVGAGTGISVAADSVSIDYVGTNNFIDSATNLEGTSIAAGDTIVYHDATDNNVKKGFVSDLPFSNNSGTVTSVAISGTDGIDVDSGSPITTTGTITLGLSNIPNSSLSNSSIDIAGTDISLGGIVTGDDIIADVSAGQITNAQLSNSSITINGSSVSLGGTINIGDITEVIAGNGLTGGGSSGSVTLNVGAGTLIDVAADTISVDLSELTTSTSNGDGDFFVVVDSANAQKKLTKGNINNSGFNNDAGYTTNSGTVTSVAISGTDGIDVDSGSPITSSGTITLGLSSIPNSSLANSSMTIAGTAISLGGSISGDDIISDVSASQITNSQLANSSVTVTAGTGLANGGSVSLGSSVTLNVGAGTGILANANDIALDYAGTDNFINSATNLGGTAIAATDTIIYHDATDNNVKKGLVSDLPFTSSAGSVTSVAISGSDGIDVDSGSPITSSGTIALGLSNVPNSSLANSSVTVTAGTGLANGGSVSLGGSVTLNVGAGTGIQVNANDIALDYAGTDNYIYAAGTGVGDITTSMFIPVSDASNNVKKYTVAALPFTNNQGTVTSVGITAGALIDVTNSPITTSGNITVAVDLSELTTSTSNGDGDFFVVVDTANAQKKLTKGNINISGFNNDAGYITSAGNTNLYSTDGTLAGARTVTQNGANLHFSTTGGANTKFYRSSIVNKSLTRVFMEADDFYDNVLELDSSDPSTKLVSGYEAGGAQVFSVDGQGNLTATSKAFDIPHPNPEKKAEGMRLKHGNLEGPEHGVYVRGRQLNDKEIELPEYWRDLVDPDSITVQLTSVGSHQNLYVKEIKDNVVYIGNGNLFSNKIDCYYFIQAERKDIEKITVEY
jgi:hypothetical protein